MLLTVLSWITRTPCGIDFWITPCQIWYPASVTTNAGTPISATIEPWNAPISAQARDRERDREHAAVLVGAAGQRELGDDDARDAADVADREVDLADQEHEHDAVGEHRHAGHLRDDVGEVARREEVVGLEREEDHDQRQADR